MNNFESIKRENSLNYIKDSLKKYCAGGISFAELAEAMNDVDVKPYLDKINTKEVFDNALTKKSTRHHARGNSDKIIEVLKQQSMTKKDLEDWLISSGICRKQSASGTATHYLDRLSREDISAVFPVKGSNPTRWSAR